MKIAVCDDDEIFLNNEIKMIKKAADDRKTDSEIYKYSSVNEIISTKIAFDIALIDIEMGKETGFKAAQYLYSQNNDCVIAFCTNFSAYMKNSFKYRAFRYILKTEPVIVIEDTIGEIIDEANRKNKYIHGIYKGKEFVIALKDVNYIETYRHLITYHTKNGDQCEYKPFIDIESEFCEFGFVRCHRSYIINIEYVRAVSDSRVFLFGSDTDSLPLGRKYEEYVKKRYNKLYMEGIM